MNSKTIASNKKARFDYFLDETFVAGLLLEGWEVKSLREGKLNLKESYIKDIKNELWLVGSRIDPLKFINQKEGVDPLRFRKLLLNKKEVKKILFAISAKGQTCVPVKLFWKGTLAKLELALARGKKNYDKKASKKIADINRDKERALKNFKFHRSPVLNIGESFKSGSPIETKVKKDLGPVEVDVKKNFVVDTDLDEQSVKLDEKIKGKVKTQKDKLRSLRK